METHINTFLNMLYNYDQRNLDFLDTVRRIRRRYWESGKTLNNRAIVAEALRQPAPQYYVSPCHICRRLADYTAGRYRPRSQRGIELFEEVLRRYRAIRPDGCPKGAAHYGGFDYVAMEGILLSPASRFFITEEYALRLVTGSARRRQEPRWWLAEYGAPTARRRLARSRSNPAAPAFT